MTLGSAMHCEQNVVTLFYQDIVKQFNHFATVTTVGGEPGPYDPVSLKEEHSSIQSKQWSTLTCVLTYFLTFTYIHLLNATYLLIILLPTY